MQLCGDREGPQDESVNHERSFDACAWFKGVAKLICVGSIDDNAVRDGERSVSLVELRSGSSQTGSVATEQHLD